MRTGGQGRLQQVFRCRAGGEPGGLGLEEQRKRGRSAVRLPASLPGAVCGLVRSRVPVGSWDKTSRGRELEGKISVIHRRWGGSGDEPGGLGLEERNGW